ncbi:protein kinase [Streptomyces sp. NPDC017086]|uniref:protein kinase domain-containing protein n=1 Tax=Streptomyces sp. NPDC017086 TaxID=3364976 RepID=UPI0037AB7D47
MEKLGAGDPLGEPPAGGRGRLGSYRLLARLGAGGMGQVYLARSDRGRTVAVKVVREELAAREEFRARFRQEVVAARRVGGYWTAPVLDADTEAAVPWVATGYVAGPSLQQVVGHDHGALPERSVRIMAAGLAYALKDIHAAGIVHRDLKPSNVLVTIDGPRVIDFGIARALESETADGAGLTRTGALVGSPGFMAPEQVRGDRITPACDVFCLGSVLAYAATGALPFGTADSGVHALMFRIAQEEPDLTGVPEGIADLVRDCLRKDPAQRPSLDTVLERTGAEDTVAGGRSRDPWLPASLVAQLGRHAVRLLEVEDPEREGVPAPASGGPDARLVPPPGVDGSGGHPGVGDGTAASSAGAGEVSSAGAGGSEGWPAPSPHVDGSGGQPGVRGPAVSSAGVGGADGWPVPLPRVDGFGGHPGGVGGPALSSADTGGLGDGKVSSAEAGGVDDWPVPPPRVDGSGGQPVPPAGAGGLGGGWEAPGADGWPVPRAGGPGDRPVPVAGAGPGSVPGGAGASPEHAAVSDGRPGGGDHPPGVASGQAPPPARPPVPPGFGTAPSAPYGAPHPGHQPSAYGYPQQPGAGPWGTGQPLYQRPYAGGPGATAPYGPQDAGGPAEERRSGRSTALLLVIALVVALGAGGSVYALMKNGGEDRDGGTAGPAPTGRSAPPVTSPGPTASKDSASPPAAGAVPDAYLGTWRTVIGNASGTNTRELTIRQGEVGDTVLTLVAEGPAEGGGSYHCVFEAELAARPAGDGPLAIGPSTVTSGEPASSCAPGEATEVSLLPDGRLKRAKATGAESLTYDKE